MQCSTNDVDPGLRNPIAILSLGVERISKVTEAVFGPGVFVIVNTLLEKDGIALLIAQEKRIPFGGNC
jgi:hypothetical protein